MINQINDGRSKELKDLAESLAAAKIQARHRGRKGRQDAAALRFRRGVREKPADGAQARRDEAELGAALVIQRGYRERSGGRRK